MCVWGRSRPGRCPSDQLRRAFDICSSDWRPFSDRDDRTSCDIPRKQLAITVSRAQSSRGASDRSLGEVDSPARFCTDRVRPALRVFAARSADIGSVARAFDVTNRPWLDSNGGARPVAGPGASATTATVTGAASYSVRARLSMSAELHPPRVVRPRRRDDARLLSTGIVVAGLDADPDEELTMLWRQYRCGGEA